MKDILQTRQFESLIFELRGFKVMIDSDLASLYETETKKLKQQVKRNTDRFPPDFVIELTNEEKEQLVTTCDRLMNLRHWSVRPHPMSGTDSCTVTTSLSNRRGSANTLLLA